MESIFNLAQANRSFNAIIKSNRVGILLPILQRDFSPLDELLQVFTASENDFYTTSYTYQPRRIVFLRPGGKTAIVLAKGGFSPPTPTGEESSGFTQILKAGKPGHSHNELPIQTVILDTSDLDSLFKYCLVVRQWEEVFPHLRWIKEPAYCRFLEPHEQHRFRRALYRWWLYAFYFHGDLPRPHGAQPVAFADDVRICQMRMYATSELVEMLDLLAVVFHLVQHYICPTLEQNPAEVRPLNCSFEEKVWLTMYRATGPAKSPTRRCAGTTRVGLAASSERTPSSTRRSWCTTLKPSIATPRSG